MVCDAPAASPGLRLALHQHGEAARTQRLGLDKGERDDLTEAKLSRPVVVAAFDLLLNDHDLGDDPLVGSLDRTRQSEGLAQVLRSRRPCRRPRLASRAIDGQSGRLDGIVEAVARAGEILCV